MVRSKVRSPVIDKAQSDTSITTWVEIGQVPDPPPFAETGRRRVRGASGRTLPIGIKLITDDWEKGICR